MYFQNVAAGLLGCVTPTESHAPNAVMEQFNVYHYKTDMRGLQQWWNSALEMACWVSRMRRCRQSSAEAGMSAVACSHAASAAFTRPKRSAQRGHSSSSASEALLADAAAWHTCTALA